jgi:hypothetical protein
MIPSDIIPEENNSAAPEEYLVEISEDSQEFDPLIPSRKIIVIRPYTEDTRTLLLQYHNLCKHKHMVHMKCAWHYQTWYVRCTIPVLTLSSLTTIMSASNAMPGELTHTLTIIVTVLSGLTTIGQSINAYLEYHVRINKHLVTAAKYHDITREIESQLRVETTLPAETLFISIKKELKNIEANEPIVPKSLQAAALLQEIKID